MFDFSSLLKPGNKKQLYILGGLVVFSIIFIIIISMVLIKPSSPPTSLEPKVKEPVYEITLGSINFHLEEAKDLGDILEISEIKRQVSRPEAVSTTEKYVEVTIKARNMGKETIKIGNWEIRELVDSQGRIFQYSRELLPWISIDNNCGAELKPGFAPSLCTAIYEVAKVATGLQVRVKSGSKEDLIDLGI
jgi:hypothetical protein